MKYLILPAMLLALAGCASTPSEHEYCRSFGLEQGNPEFAKCIDFYYQQEAQFRGDRAVCEAEADRTYPSSLYSRPMSYPVRTFGPGFGFGAGPFGYAHGGGFPRTQFVHVGADYQQIAEVDRLRMTIIHPCMRRQGWESGATWQAGRITPTKAVPVKPLPWLKK